MYVVVVTWGTQANKVFANAPTRQDADDLRVIAKAKGYTDARVESEKNFRASQEAYRNREASPRGPAGEAQGVHGVRRQSRAA